MSAMEFREPNQVLWRGVRPGHNGTQILKQHYKANGVRIVHTVTAGKTLYLLSSLLHYSADVTGSITAAIRDTGDNIVFYLGISFVFAGVSTPPVSWHFWPPAEIPAGYDIFVSSSAAGLTAWLGISGWEE